MDAVSDLKNCSPDSALTSSSSLDFQLVTEINTADIPNLPSVSSISSGYLNNIVGSSEDLVESIKLETSSNLSSISSNNCNTE